ncbi:pitrilysin family protein [Bacillaceae bacterium IKA-2]|nr:pitrilysin family protein [Bacillaceae bacterium IKA-2]
MNLNTSVRDIKVDRINLHVIETDKYKTNTIVLHIRAPLRKNTVTKRALLPYVLQSGTEQFTSRQEIRSYLDELYGASLSVDVSKKGENQILSFRMDIANEKYLKDKTPLLEEAIKLLAEIILKPITENGVFQSTIVDNEKRNLKQRIESIFDDKMRYANMRITEEMCKDERYGINVWGYEEEIESVTPQELYQQYKEILANDLYDLYVVGDVNSNEIEKIVKTNFSLAAQTSQVIDDQQKGSTETKVVKKEKVVFEEQDIKRGKLHIGFRTSTTFQSENYFAMQMFNGLFGGFSHSKLFINVREKASLAYYAASRYESHKGLLMVMSGIEFKNYDQAVKIIKEQLKSMQNGDFSDSEIEQTKAVLKNQVLETVDAAKGYVELLYHNAVANKVRSIEDWIFGIESVTKEDIINVGRNVHLDTIYFLTGKEEK